MDTADRSWPYVTTNAQYGNFYGTVIREVQKDDYDRHHECNKQAARLAAELEEAQACLEQVDYRNAMRDTGQYAPRGACCLQEKRGPYSRCQCNHRTPGCYKNPYKLGSEVIECDWGQSREPEYLEDHVKHYHPRLASKQEYYLPKFLADQSNRCGPGGGFLNAVVCMNMCGSGVEVRPVGSGGGSGVGLQTGIRSSGSRKKRRSRPTSLPDSIPGLRNLPTSARYGFYRLYGTAGQGAKTSGGYHPRSYLRTDDC